MIEDEPIDLKMENRRLGNELSLLRQKNEELKEDRDYIKSLLDVEFEKRIKLSKENEQLKSKLSDYRKENYGLLDGMAYKDEVEIPKLSEKISDLECEIEQLKQEIETLQEQLAHFDIGDGGL